MLKKHSLAVAKTRAFSPHNSIKEKRLEMVEKPDGTFRVTEQERAGEGLSKKFSLAVLSLGFGLKDILIWKNSKIVREYATRKEAEELLTDFNADVKEARKIMRDFDDFPRREKEKFEHLMNLENIPQEDRPRYIKEKGITL
ncbi:MAG: hypothetical protein V1721_01925 [Pseudomonadota bacterium]